MELSKNHITVAFIGLTLGIFSVVTHSLLPRGLDHFSASYSIWLICAFVAGLFATSKKQALLYGAFVPLVAFASAYIPGKMFTGMGPVGQHMLVYMFIIVIIVGPFIANLARLWKQNTKWAALAPVIVSSLLISEGLADFVKIMPDLVGYFYIPAGLIAFALLYKKGFVLPPIVSALAVIPLSMFIYFVSIIYFAIGLLITYGGSGFGPAD